MEMMQSEYDNRPWETLFHGNHRFKEYQKVKMFKDYLKRLEDKGIGYNRNMYATKNEEEFKKIIAT